MLLEPSDTDYSKVCRVCGGKRAMIRGRFPHTPQRNVCPTCMIELIEGLFDHEAFGIHEAQQEKV